MKKILFTVTVILLIAAFGISAFLVVNYISDTRKQKELNSTLAQIASGSTPIVTVDEPDFTTRSTAPEETDPPETNPLDGYKALHSMNSDMVGWIQIEGTELNYPVMHAPDRKDYYLKRDFLREDNVAGSIYIREACDLNNHSDNVTIYGHHMRDGSMFAPLNKYVEKATWENNPYIKLDTLEEQRVYKIFAVFRTSANLGEGFRYQMFVDGTEQEFNDFVSTCKRLSIYNTGITPTYGDKIISLSTCEYTLGDNSRLVVAAVLQPAEEAAEVAEDAAG